MKKIIIVILLILCPLNNAFSYVDINIENSEARKLKIIFNHFNFVESSSVPFVSERKKEESSDVISKVSDIVKNDLLTTNLFEFAKKSSLLKFGDFSSKNKEAFVYRIAGIDAILKGSFAVRKNSLVLKIELMDILDNKKVFDKYYVIGKKNWKKTAHTIAEHIYKNLTGEPLGHFNSRILYIAETGKSKNRKRRVAMVNFDGSGLHYLTDSNNLVLTPIFSKKNTDEIFYLKYNETNYPKIQKMNIKSGISKEIGGFREMSFAPNFHPADRNVLALSAFKNGISNIYQLDLDNDKITKITYDKSIDTTPSFSPNGEKIVFCSDRSGSQKLYVMNKNGRGIKKITHGRGNYSKPAWSPDGKLIAFVKFRGGKSSVGVISPGGESERTLVSAYLVEGVKWSPGGRYIIYSKQLEAYGRNSIPYIYIMDVMTGHEHRVPTPLQEGAVDPDWIKS